MHALLWRGTPRNLITYFSCLHMKSDFHMQQLENSRKIPRPLTYVFTRGLLGPSKWGEVTSFLSVN